MCEVKTVLLVALLLLAATGFCIYQVFSETKVGHHSEIKTESPGGKRREKYCLNGSGCCYLVGVHIVGCNCTWLYGGQRCEKYMWWT